MRPITTSKTALPLLILEKNELHPSLGPKTVLKLKVMMMQVFILVIPRRTMRILKMMIQSI